MRKYTVKYAVMAKMERRKALTIIAVLLLAASILLSSATGMCSVYAADENDDLQSDGLSWIAAEQMASDGLLLFDGADLLTDTEESDLILDMSKLTEYGNVEFYSINDNEYGDAYDFADAMVAAQKVNGDNSEYIVFVIDMDTREIYLYTTRDDLSASQCYSITDNSYTFASDGEYYECASEVYSQTLDVLEGRRIAQPMKYVSNVLMALMISMLIVFIWLMATTGNRKAGTMEMIESAGKEVIRNDGKMNFVRRDVIHHESAGGGGGSGSGGGGSGGGGGGHGGGHSF